MKTKINVTFYPSTDEIEAIVYNRVILEENPMKFKLTKSNINKILKSFFVNFGTSTFDDVSWSYDNSENYELIVKIQDAVNKHF